MKLLDKTPEEIVGSQRARLHPVECLSLKEVHYLRWRAGGRHVSSARREKVAKHLMGVSSWSKADEQALRQKEGWREVFSQLRREQNHWEETGKQMAEETIPLAVRVWRKSLKAVDKELDNVHGDQMGAARAAPPLVAPALTKLWPRKDELTQAAVVIQLTAAQSAALSAPELVVQASEVEILPPSEP